MDILHRRFRDRKDAGGTDLLQDFWNQLMRKLTKPIMVSS